MSEDQHELADLGSTADESTARLNNAQENTARVKTDKRAVGSADRGFNAAFELVMTPALFGFLGYLLDGWLGTGPVFTVSFVVFVAGYLVWKLWYNYSADMDVLQAELLQRRSGQGPEIDHS